jgi:hypothetical protein
MQKFVGRNCKLAYIAATTPKSTARINFLAAYEL